MLGLKSITAIFFSSFIFYGCTGERIVVLHTIGSKSQFYAVRPVIEELAKRGHQLTVFTPFKGITKNTENINEVVLSNVARIIEEADIDWFAMQKQGPMQTFTMLDNLASLIVIASEQLFTHPYFRKIVDERSVDLFIVDALNHEFTYPIIDKVGVPFVLHSSSAAFSSTLDVMGAPLEYASVPNFLSEFNNRMTFIERVVNVLTGEMIKPLQNYYITKQVEAIVQREFPGVRSMTELEGEPSLYITNTHPVVNWPRSLPPTILPIGALHVTQPKPLPPKLQTFADEAKEGFIIFTLGSFISVSSMPKDLVDTFIRVLSQLPQRVFWKWEGDFPGNVPSNIMIVNGMLPQQDLLGHPNARLFINHAGLLGIQETIYHGVPMLALPFGNDQRANAAKAERDGWGLKLDWDKVNDQNLKESIIYLINDPRIRESTKKFSKLMRDEIMPGKDVAAYWIEYVIRHGSTKHLQLASKNMPFHQKHLLDVVLFLVVIVFVLLLSCYYILRFLVSKCFKRSPPKTKRQ